MLLFVRRALRALDPGDPSGDAGDAGREGASLLKDRLGAGGPKIRCPKCTWAPRAEDRWFCNCSYSWNTFDTRGRCPACHYQWTVTACLSCSEWSPHKDWYVR
ncbi:hypothetical protein [Sorangium sp. So ce1000]|uniref:hypothetical protein n=1 Tax=Sorangium sp. So ce1000 TaxID=3133325 RepID=UPI003F5DDB72